MDETNTLTLNSPITEEQWDVITDVDFDRTDRMLFHTKHGKEVEFVKVIRCKDCIRNGTPDCAMEYHYLDSDWRFNDYSWNNENDYCSYGERKEG